jgi:hypothetical protein
MSLSLDRNDRTVYTRTRVAMRVRGGIHAILSLIGCAAILLAGEIFVISSPATAQSAKQKAAVMKDLQARRIEGACKVTAAGFLISADNVHIVVQCPGKEPMTASSRHEAGAGDQITQRRPRSDQYR